MTGPIATLDVVVLDTPDPRGLADFYCALLGWQVEEVTETWITIRGSGGAGLAFQLSPDFRPPTWPDNEVPQQFHLDVNVDDLDRAEEQAMRIGATATGLPGGEQTFRVLRDPSGHPFCLCRG